MTEDRFKYDVFLSYSSKDKEFTRLLDRKLRAVGIKTFFDEKDIPWGSNIPANIEEALDLSQHLIIVLSPDAVESEWVDLERCVNIFRSPGGKERSILPLLRRDCEKIPAAIRVLRYLPVRNDEEFQSAWPQIVDHLGRTLARKLVPTPLNIGDDSLRGKSLAVACPLFGASRIYYTELISAIWLQASNHGYELLIVPIKDPGQKRRLISHFPQLLSISGMILITCQVEGSNWLDECASQDLPVVLLHDNISEENARGYSVASYIWPRLDALAELVHLLVAMRGCRNLSVAMVDPKNHAIRSEKLSIIKSALDEHGLSLKTDRQLFYVREYSYAQGVDVVGRILEENPSTDGIICLADVTAIGILDRLDKLGLRGQIKVTGFDNVEVAAQNDLTTIDQQLHLTGERALLDLHTAIDNVPFKEFRAGSYIPTILVQRGSA